MSDLTLDQSGHEWKTNSKISTLELDLEPFELFEGPKTFFNNAQRKSTLSERVGKKLHAT